MTNEQRPGDDAVVIPVVLRPFEPTDDAALRSLFEDRETRRWNPVDAPDLALWRTRQNDRDGSFETWAVAEEDGGRLLGIVSVFDIDRAQGDAELGYRVVPAERGRGVARAGLVAISRRSHETLGLRRLQLFHAVENPASCRVAEAAGFRHEGTLRQSYVYGDGQPHDEHLHARLATDG